MATITIGDKAYLIPEMNFVAIERAWPYVEKATNSFNPVDGVSASLGVFAAALMEAPDFKKEDYQVGEWDRATGKSEDEHIHESMIHFFKKQLKGTELSVVRETMFEVLKEAGLEVTEGEAQNALVAAVLGREDLLPETAPDTSQSSLPLDAKEETGTS